MGKTLQLLFRQNIVPRWWKFWMNKEFRIWSNGSNFGAGTWWGAVTQDALMIPAHIISATVCHWLHSASNCNRQWLRSETTFTSSIEALQSLSLQPSVFSHIAPLIGKYNFLILFHSKKGPVKLQENLQVNSWALFTIATSVWFLYSS